MEFTLKDALINMPHSQLRQILARLHLRRRNQDSKNAYVQLITQAWSTPATVQEFLATLSPEATAVLSYLLHMPSVPASLFWWEHGEIRGNSLTSTPATISEELYLYGILHAAEGGPIQKAKRIGIPLDLSAQLIKTIVPQKPARTQPQYRVGSQPPHTLLHDLLQALLFMQQLEQTHTTMTIPPQSPLQHQRWLTPHQLTQLHNRLYHQPQHSPHTQNQQKAKTTAPVTTEIDLRHHTHKQDRWCAQLFYLAHAAGLMQNGLLTDAIWPWLHQSPSEQTAHLHHAWQNAPSELSRTYAQAHVQPHVQPFAHLPAPWPQMLLAALQTVGRLNANSTFSAQDLSTHLLGECEQFDPFFRAHFDTLTDVHTAVSAALSGPMVDLGIVDVEIVDIETDRAKTETDTAAQQPSQTIKISTATPQASLHIAQDEWQIAIPNHTAPVAQAWLTTCGTHIHTQLQEEPKQLLHTYQLDRNSVAAASANGIGIAPILAIFPMLQLSLTAAQTQQLAAWHDQGQTLQIDTVPLLRARTASNMAQLFAHPALRTLLHPLLSATTAQINGPIHELVEQLQQSGFYPQTTTADQTVSSSSTTTVSSPINAHRNALWLACRVYQLLGQQIPLPMPIPTSLLQTLTHEMTPTEHQTLEKELKQIGTRLANLLDGYITSPAPSIGQPEQWVQPLTTVIDNNAATPDTATKQRVELTYYSAGRNQTTRRIVQPYWLEEQHTYKYLRAYCHSADEVRLFRLDRILAVSTQ